MIGTYMEFSDEAVERTIRAIRGAEWSGGMYYREAAPLARAAIAAIFDEEAVERAAMKLCAYDHSPKLWVDIPESKRNSYRAQARGVMQAIGAA